MSEALYLPYTTYAIPPSEAFPTGEVRDYPLIPVGLSYSGQTTAFEFLAIIDSGADHCVFPALFGRQVGIPIETGRKASTVGVTGVGLTYYHQVDVLVYLQEQSYQFTCYAGFMPDLDPAGVGLLGRDGFFNLFAKVAFNTSQRVVEFTLREQQA